MAGGATFNPQVLVDGKRPFDLYPSGQAVLERTIVHTLKTAMVTTSFATVFWPIYRACARRWRSAGLGEAGFFTLGFVATINATYLSMHAFFCLIEHKRWLEVYKIDRQPHQLGSWKLALATLKQELLGKFITGPILIYALLYRVFKRRGMPAFDAARPSLLQFFLHFLVSVLVNDVGFYSMHRLAHSKPLYARIHKQHHEWKGTVSYAAEYAHPIEQVFANFLPTMGGCFLMRAHPWTLYVWVAKRLYDTYEAHSGYAFKVPVLPRLGLVNWRAAANHDFHHTGNSGNFGAPWLDWIFGTMDAYAILGGDEAYIKSKMDDKLSYMRPVDASKTK